MLNLISKLKKKSTTKCIYFEEYTIKVFEIVAIYIKKVIICDDKIKLCLHFHGICVYFSSHNMMFFLTPVNQS